MTKEVLANGWYQLTIKMQTKADSSETEQQLLQSLCITLSEDLKTGVLPTSIYGIELTQVSDEAAKTFASL